MTTQDDGLEQRMQEVKTALEDVARLGGQLYPTGTDRAFLCHAAVILAAEVTRLSAAESLAAKAQERVRELEIGLMVEAGDERTYPVYAIRDKKEELWYYEPFCGNRYGSGDGWLMCLPWGEEHKRGGLTRGDNRIGLEVEDALSVTLLSPALDTKEGVI